jgi:hypothetical protein
MFNGLLDRYFSLTIMGDSIEVVSGTGNGTDFQQHQQIDQIDHPKASKKSLTGWFTRHFFFFSPAIGLI